MPSTTYGYAKNLATMFLQHEANVTPLRTYQKALAKQGALVPTKQAPPVSKMQLLKLLRVLTPRAAACALLAWKTASRWTETASITKDQLVEVSDERIIIYWGQKTKSSKVNPYTPAMFTVVEGDLTPRLSKILRNLPQGQPLCTMTCSQVTRLMKRHIAPNYSSHSIKSGAISRLFEAASKGLITVEQIMRIAKHKDVSTTLRYARNLAHAAIALGTQGCTNLL